MSDENFNSVEGRWYALRVKSRYEKLVAAKMASRGLKCFLPLCTSRRRWSDRVKSVDFPLFPGYVFCPLHTHQRLMLLTIPGVLHIVGIGKTPAPIDDLEIAAIEAAVQSGFSVEPWPFLETGPRARLVEGPLAGLEGIVVGDSRPHRMIVSISLLRRSVAVAIERRWINPKDVSGWPAEAGAPSGKPGMPVVDAADNSGGPSTLLRQNGVAGSSRFRESERASLC